MKLSLFVGALACAGTAVAQTNPSSTAPATKPDTQTLTMTGCVTAGANARDAFTLTSPSLVSMASKPAPPPGPTDASVPPPGTTSTAVGTTGSATTPKTTDATSAAAASSPTGYWLTGADVSAYAGKRVRIVGMLVPSPNAAATAGAASSSVVGPTGMTGAANPAGMPVLPAFRVVTIAPVAGPCSPR